MKNLNLESFGVQELTQKEMNEIDGGGIFGAIIGFVGGLIIAGLDGHKNPMAVALACGMIGAGLPI